MKNLLINSTSKPLYFDDASINSSHKEVLDTHYSSPFWHCILSPEYSTLILDSSVQATSPSLLSKIVGFALDHNVGDREKSTLDNLLTLMKFIAWPLGNIIPGPNVLQRVDINPRSNDKSPIRECSGSLITAHAYACSVECRLTALLKKPSLSNWWSLIALVAPSGVSNCRAHAEICEWSDAWATHSKYKIYARIDRSDTQQARSRGRKQSCGAWIIDELPLFQELVPELDKWQVQINSCSALELPFVVNRLRRALNNRHGEKWLTCHGSRIPVNTDGN